MAWWLGRGAFPALSLSLSLSLFKNFTGSCYCTLVLSRTKFKCLTLRQPDIMRKVCVPVDPAGVFIGASFSSQLSRR